MEDIELLKEVKVIAKGIDPQWCNSFEDCEGEGFVDDSIFFVRHGGLVLWIVSLFDGQIAFKELYPEVLENLEDIILESPRIFVKFNRCHRIEEFAAIQEKEDQHE